MSGIGNLFNLTNGFQKPIGTLSQEHLKFLVGLYPAGFNQLGHCPQPCRGIDLHDNVVADLISWKYLRPVAGDAVILTDTAYSNFDAIREEYQSHL